MSCQGVKVLTLGFTRFGYRYRIDPDADMLPRYNEPKENSNKTFKELENTNESRIFIAGTIMSVK